MGCIEIYADRWGKIHSRRNRRRERLRGQAIDCRGTKKSQLEDYPVNMLDTLICPPLSLHCAPGLHSISGPDPTSHTDRYSYRRFVRPGLWRMGAIFHYRKTRYACMGCSLSESLRGGNERFSGLQASAGNISLVGGRRVSTSYIGQIRCFRPAPRS